MLLDDRVSKTKNIILDALFKSAKQKWKSNRASSGSPRFFWHLQHILDEDKRQTRKLKIFYFGEEEGEKGRGSREGIAMGEEARVQSERGGDEMGE